MSRPCIERFHACAVFGNPSRFPPAVLTVNSRHSDRFHHLTQQRTVALLQTALFHHDLMSLSCGLTAAIAPGWFSRFSGWFTTWASDNEPSVHLPTGF
jgi:hypothetical protein